MDSKAVSTGRQSDLADFVFKGQCYDAGLHSKTKCALCGRAVRHVYILKDPENRSVPTGSECFSKFKDTNPKLYKELKAAEIWLNTTIEAEERDKKIFQPRAEVNERIAAWRKLKTQAIRKVRDYRRATGKEWLPESLFELHEAATKMPVAYKRASAAIKFYDEQIQLLKTKIEEVSR